MDEAYPCGGFGTAPVLDDGNGPKAYADRVNPSPAPSPIDVIMHSAPATWWEIVGALGPLVALLAAFLAAAIGWFTLKQRSTSDFGTLAQKKEADATALLQKQRSDDRAEWWRRTQWALDRALDLDPATKALGLATLAVLAESQLAHIEELKLLDIAWQSVTDSAHGNVAGPAPTADGMVEGQYGDANVPRSQKGVHRAHVTVSRAVREWILRTFVRLAPAAHKCGERWMAGRARH